MLPISDIPGRLEIPGKLDVPGKLEMPGRLGILGNDGKLIEPVKGDEEYILELLLK